MANTKIQKEYLDDELPHVLSGAGAPASTPAKVGNIYIDTTGDDAYIAVGTASSADWEKTNDGAGGGSGDVVGPASATNNALALFDLTTGKLLKNSTVTLVSGVLAPATTDTVSLGSTALQWSDLFLAEGGVINWDNGDATLSQTGNLVQLTGANLRVGGGSYSEFGSANLTLDDTVNYFVSGVGGFNWDGDVLLTKTSNLLTLSGGDLVVPDEAYDATTWNGNFEVPTKNAIRDKIESMGGGGGGGASLGLIVAQVQNIIYV